MPAICRVGDTNGVGGKLTEGSSTVLLDGLPIALHPNTITPHQPWPRKQHYPQHHHDAKTVAGYSTSLMVEGKPVVLVGTSTTCGHSIADGSSTGFTT